MLKMKVVLSGADFAAYRDAGYGLMFGGYAFTTNVKGEEQTVNFDFDSFIANVADDGRLILEAGERTPFGGSEDLMDCYDEEYEEAGFSRKDLTAKVLSNATYIDEFCVSWCEDAGIDFDDVHIDEIVFSNGKKEYRVMTSVCDSAQIVLVD